MQSERREQPMKSRRGQLPRSPRGARSLRVSLTPQERKQFERYARQLLDHPQVLQMERFIQHGSVSCLEHSVAVAELSFWICRRLGLRADWNSLVRGALLHDFFLYDWHDKAPDRPGLHGFTHPKTALKNAERLFPLTEPHARQLPQIPRIRGCLRGRQMLLPVGDPFLPFLRNILNGQTTKAGGASRAPPAFSKGYVIRQATRPPKRARRVVFSVRIVIFRKACAERFLCCGFPTGGPAPAPS